MPCALARGVPFADRGAAALRSVATGNSYSDELAGLRGAADADKAAHPWAATAGSLVGGSLLPFGMLGSIAKGASLGGKVIGGGLTGAGIGATQGLSDTHDLTDYAGRCEVTRERARMIGAPLSARRVPMSRRLALARAIALGASLLSQPVEGTSRVTSALLGQALSATIIRRAR